MARCRRVSEYEVRVHPDGSWYVTHIQGEGYTVSRSSVGSGKEPDQRRGEVVARMAIEDHKAQRAKDRIEAKGILSFTVEG